MLTLFAILALAFIILALSLEVLDARAERDRLRRIDHTYRSGPTPSHA